MDLPISCSKLHMLLKRVSRTTNFKVYMTSGRAAGRSYAGYDLTLGYVLPGGDKNLRGMSVESLGAVGVADNNIFTVPTIPTRVAGQNDSTGSRSQNRGPAGATDIYAIVPMKAL